MKDEKLSGDRKRTKPVSYNGWVARKINAIIIVVYTNGQIRAKEASKAHILRRKKHTTSSGATVMGVGRGRAVLGLGKK